MQASSSNQLLQPSNGAVFPLDLTSHRNGVGLRPPRFDLQGNYRGQAPYLDLSLLILPIAVP